MNSSSTTRTDFMHLAAVLTISATLLLWARQPGWW